jgi:hypothetical protein
VGSLNIPVSAWTFVAVVVNSGIVSMYVNGKLDGSFPARAGSMVNTSDLQIGRRDPAFGGSHFSGCIHELEHPSVPRYVRHLPSPKLL